MSAAYSPKPLSTPQPSESLTSMNSLHHSQSDYGWNDDGQREPIYTPDMAEAIDGPDETQISADEAITVMAKTMNEVLHFCFEHSNNGKVDLSRAFRRFASLVWVMRPELFDHQSLAALSPHLHVTRAALSAIARKFCDRYGLRNVLMKKEGARLKYSEARKAAHARGVRLKAKPGTPRKMPGSVALDLQAPHSEAHE